ncbi:hypothetical protein [Streptomyces europaeiscabiei]|uniref:hypothetical protein n=2 Tax=Streptomyces europaeiscabiei TaxID=146819 RepID=UPI000E67829B|nr:hypothetical protein [Streptomyces europaeiscabiei]MDX2526590.1 hypothetical protein [Streptomyces europaeiscabiei]MDX3711358.1 hypothetical protein [Streptomyces europaeiscabiei]MDX3839972.1 hypothetical protein [Streptomyces europaeiscabiei]
MSEKDPEISRIDGEIGSIRKSMNGAGNKDSIDNRLKQLEEKKYVLKHEFNEYKAEVTGFVSDWKGFALEVVAAKLAWDIIKIELPSVLKLNEEAVLKRLNLRYTDDPENTRLIHRLERIPRPEPTPTPTPTNTPTPAPAARPTNATPGQPANGRTTTPAPVTNPTPPRRTAPDTTPTTPTTGETRRAVGEARGATDETNRLNTAAGGLRRTMDGR